MRGIYGFCVHGGLLDNKTLREKYRLILSSNTAAGGGEVGGTHSMLALVI